MNCTSIPVPVPIPRPLLVPGPVSIYLSLYTCSYTYTYTFTYNYTYTYTYTCTCREQTETQSVICPTDCEESVMGEKEGRVEKNKKQNTGYFSAHKFNKTVTCDMCFQSNEQSSMFLTDSGA